MIYLRLIAIPFIVGAIYSLAWISHRPDVWHDIADSVICWMAILGGAMILTCPFELPWEKTRGGK